MNIQNCSFCKRCHVMCRITLVQEFHLMLYLNAYIFFSLNTGKNADPYIIKLSSLSSNRECDDEPDGTLFL